ncbi:MAG: Nucleoside-diphosphate-sugar epimerase [Solirubrobacterales bacterium]|nr:Nucleoside-diphosphate-sugar epimerase [Solirubrobacterales bacterium]
MTAPYTVIGAGGFIGRHLVDHLRAQGRACWAPARGESLAGRDLGHVILCAGTTGDWARRPFETVDAHVALPAALVRDGGFASLLYLSSTRVYDRHPGALAHEDDELRVRPGEPGDLYAMSKLAGEAAVLAGGGRVARLANVYGPQMDEHAFLAMLLRDAAGGRIRLESSLDSARDFVSVADVVAILARIAAGGRERVYNVASGRTVTNRELSDALMRLTGCEREVAPAAPVRRRPPVCTVRIRDEFGFAPARLADELPALLEARRAAAGVGR